MNAHLEDYKLNRDVINYHVVWTEIDKTKTLEKGIVSEKHEYGQDRDLEYKPYEL